VSGNAVGAASVGGHGDPEQRHWRGRDLSAAGKVLAFIPNEMGKALLHNERL
jgi:hypothetical protein